MLRFLLVAAVISAAGAGAGASETPHVLDQLAQAMGTVCETSIGVCPLLTPQPVGTGCTCPTSTGTVDGVVVQ